MKVWQWIAAIGGGMAAILLPIRLWREAVTHWTSLREWLRRRSERRDKLDKLIDGDGTDCKATCNRYADELGEIGTSLDEIKEDLKAIKERNAEQDREITDSLEEREIHSKALFALLDVAKKQGNNGPVSAAHDELKNHLVQIAHRKEYL